MTNGQIKPHLYVNPALIRRIFKWFVSRAKKLCYEKYLDKKLNFLVNMFMENRHDRNHLYSIIRENKRQAPKTENTDSNIVKLPQIPIIGPKIRKELRKTGCKFIFKSAAKLKNILCKNESKLL